MQRSQVVFLALKPSVGHHFLLLHRRVPAGPSVARPFRRFDRPIARRLISLGGAGLASLGGVKLIVRFITLAAATSLGR